MRSFGNIEPIIEKLCDTSEGFYVDIGSHDGLDGNNTKYFEEKGWEGVCIEPHPIVFEKLKVNRKCQVENCAIWKEDTEVDFLAVSGYSEMLSGIIESYDPRHVDRINREISAMGGHAKKIKIPARRFDSIIKNNHINFLSIDTEGSEIEILKNVDFEKFQIDVICIENNFNDPSFEKFFNERGYHLHSTHLGCDQIYAKRK
jgi:FkbM family methyltransferase